MGLHNKSIALVEGEDRIECKRKGKQADKKY